MEHCHAAEYCGCRRLGNRLGKHLLGHTVAFGLSKPSIHQQRFLLVPMTILFRKFSFYLAVAGIVCLVMLVRSLSQQPPMPDPPVKPPAKPATARIAASGLVEAQNENTNIGVPLPGLVVDITVKVWEPVKASQVLLRMDDRDLKAQLISQEAQVRVAQASLKRLQDQLERLKSVKTPGAVTQDEISTRENDVAVATAQADAASATVGQTKALIDRLTIRAPIDGVILQVNNRVGEYISPTQKEAPVVMGQIQKLQVRADVDEQLAPQVKEHQHATAYLKGDPERPIPLQFARIEPFIVPKVSLTGSSSERVDTRVLQVIFTMDPPPGMKVYVGQQLDIFLDRAENVGRSELPQESP